MKTAERPSVQSLEARRLMAAAALVTSTSAYAGGTMLKISGTLANDTITLSYNGSAYTLKSAAGFTKVLPGDFTAIQIKAGKGNDRVTVDASVTASVFLYGEDGNDTLRGGSGDDSIYSGAGSNWLYGESGRDTLVSVGGNTNDGLTGGGGEDFFWLDNKTTERLFDANSAEKVRSVNRINAFETSRFTTGTKRTEAVTNQLLGQRFRDPDLTSKTYVYKRFDNRPLFSADGPGADDVRQGQVGDCYFLSTVAGVADVTPDVIRSMMVDLGDGTYGVRFKAKGVDKFYRVDNDLAVYNKTSTAPAYAALGQGGSMWVAVAEKAFAYARRTQGTYASLNSGWMTEAYNAIGAKAEQTMWNSDADSADEYLDWVQSRLDAGDVVTLACFSNSEQLNLVGGHAYTVDRVETAGDGTRQLVIRNPWGVDGYYAAQDGQNDGYVTLNANAAFTAIDAFVSARVA
ncbi:MAG TPA: C2 family cysteine protease [Tepidisphaeraceae bacterium]|jgi:hypothetical protein